MVSNTLTGVNSTYLPSIPSTAEASEEMSELSWFKSSLSQTVELEDFFDIAKSFSLSRSEMAANKRRPWFKIGGRSPYLLALVKDPYRIVEFFFGKESWPSGSIERFPFYIMYTFSSPEALLELYLAPQNVLVLSTVDTDPQPVLAQEMDPGSKNTLEKEALLARIPSPPDVHLKIEAEHTLVSDDFSYLPLIIMAESFISLSPLDEIAPLYDAKEVPNTAHLPQKCIGTGHAPFPQEDIGQGEIPPEIHDTVTPLIGALSDDVNENAPFCDAHDVQRSVCDLEADRLHNENVRSVPTQVQQDLRLTKPSAQESAPTKNHRIPPKLYKKNARNTHYSGPRRRARICECHKHNSGT